MPSCPCGKPMLASQSDYCAICRAKRKNARVRGVAPKKTSAYDRRWSAVLASVKARMQVEKSV
jgi:hypothetical protein